MSTATPQSDNSTTAHVSPQDTSPDDRLRTHTGFAKLIRRPELASLLGFLVILALFLAVAPAFRSFEAMATILYASSTLGIVALAVGLLMIGGEFDLSSGVAVTTAALAATMLNYNLHLNSWVGAGIALVISLSIGALNGILVSRTGIDLSLIHISEPTRRPG